MGQCRRRGDLRQRYRRRRRANRPARRYVTRGGSGASREVARFWREFRPHADLRLLACRSWRRQARGADRGGRAGGTAATARRAGLSPVRQMPRTDRRFRPRRPTRLCQRRGAGASVRSDHAVGARHRDARRNRARNRQCERTAHIGNAISRSTPRVSAKMPPACCCSQYRGRPTKSHRRKRAARDGAIRRDRTARDAVRRGRCDRVAGPACRGCRAGGGTGFRFERN